MSDADTDTDTDLMSAIELQVAEYRTRNKLRTDASMEVAIPHHEVERLVREHGSLEAASTHLFGSSVTLVDAYWSDFCLTVTDKVNARLGYLFDRGYFTRRNPTSDYTQGVVIPKWVKQKLTTEQITQLEESGAVFT